MSTRITTLRMPEGLADALAAVARACEEPISEIVRAAIENELVRRRSDPTFQERRKKILENDVAALKRLEAPRT
jgi:predicted transcriptional regulator